MKRLSKQFFKYLVASAFVASLNLPFTVFAQTYEEPSTSNILLLAYIHLQQQKTLTPDTDPVPSNPNSQELYITNLEQQVVQAKCVACHISGGVASSSKLIFNKGDNQSSANYKVLENLLAQSGIDSTYVLNKTLGVGHGGAKQLSSSGQDYLDLKTVLEGIEGCTDCKSEIITTGIFAGVNMSSARQILRKSSLLFTGRFPSEAEYQTFERASDAQKKQLLIDSFKGQEFHSFIKNSANDKLLFRALHNGIEFHSAQTPWGNYPTYWNIKEKFAKYADDNPNDPNYWNYHHSILESAREEPYELIAYVIENDLPYSEILTADYTMVNPYTNEFYRSGLDFDYQPSENFEWGKELLNYRPGRNQGQLVDNGANNSYEVDSPDGGTRPGYITSHSEAFLDYPHAGILNTFAFLDRYPNTETNRNRAHSRWVYYHFLGVDIERSAPRSQKQEDLTDTNNPTMNNPACSVCHEIMDPVAGVFQNYGIVPSSYRGNGGEHSLPWNYISPPDGQGSLYQQGDLWYRDMRKPGFNGEELTDNDKSLQWLAHKIVNDDRFPKATVQFWWSAVMGAELLHAPEESSDFDFNIKLSRYEAQQETIKQLATDFKTSGLNFKSLLADMVMSPWFAAGSMDPSKANIQLLADIGRGQLLTPEKISRKVRAIMGFSWGEFPIDQGMFPGQKGDNFSDSWQFKSFIGGIDSFAVTKRPRQLNVSMYNVLSRQADDISAAISAIEFYSEPKDRKLLKNLSVDDIPTDLSRQADIKDVIAQMYFTMWGDEVATDGPEVERLFNLLKDLYQDRKSRNIDHMYNEFFWMKDPVTGQNVQPGSIQCGCEQTGHDPTYMKGSWAGLIRYFLSHFKFVSE